MKLSPVQIQNLTEALIVAFYRKTNLEQMVRFSELNENLDAIVGGTNLREIAFNLVQWAEAHEKVEELLMGARKANADNSKLNTISQELLATTLDVIPGQLESIVQQSVNFDDIEHWLEQVKQCSLAVCRIEFPVGTPRGSGFLLGSDIVVSNYHVIAGIVDHSSFKDDLTLRFDYKTDKHGEKQQAGIEHHLVGAKNGIITSSPLNKLDYVLLRINISNHHQQIRLALKPQKHTFTQGEPLCIIQHPQGNPQKIALGSLSQIQTTQNRIYYTVNTCNGSSGSPCVNSDGIVVALHQGNKDGDSNRGIPFSAILEDLQRKKLLNLLGIQ